MRNYALKDGKVKESYIREYSNRSPKREAREASRSYCVQQSREEQTKEEIGEPNEIIREKELVEAHQQGQQRVQEPAEGRPEAEEGNHEVQTRKEEEVNGEESSGGKRKRRASKRSGKSAQKTGGVECGEVQEGS